MSEYSRKEDRKNKPKIPIFYRPTNSGGLMSCVRRTREWSGGLVSCVDIDYGSVILDIYEDDFLKRMKETMEKIKKEKSLENFGYFWENTEQS